MLIKPAKDVRASCTGDCSCPDCGTRFTATGRHVPVLVDDTGRPYCRTHGRSRSPDWYGKLVDTYAEARDIAVGAAEAGLMNSADLAMYYASWDGPPLDPDEF
jgi:hypothetical protein